MLVNNCGVVTYFSKYPVTQCYTMLHLHAALRDNNYVLSRHGRYYLNMYFNRMEDHCWKITVF